MEAAISPKLAVCPKCEHPFFVNENEIDSDTKRIYYIQRDSIPDVDELDDWYEYLCDMPDDNFKQLCMSNGYIHTLESLAEDIRGSDCYINDEYYARVI